jgi:uncharacterized protein (TIGR03000 family)
MYSLVLLMALSGSAEAPALGHHGCCSGYSCCGGYSYGCCGGYSYGCCGGYSYGCCGGYSYGCCGGCHGGHHHGHHHSCCGGYSYGCCGGYSYGCCGGYSYGCCGGYGYGCCGGYGSCGGGVIVAPAAPMAPAAPAAPGGAAPGAPPEKPMGDKPAAPAGGGSDKPKEEVSVPASATIIVSLPADAKLMVDDHATTSTSATRVFVSPELAPGKAFQYTLRAEMVRDGEKLQASEVVTVRAGGESRITLTPTKVVASRVAQK